MTTRIADIATGYLPVDFIGSAVELGACDGIYLSNTLELEQQGWKVLCIEPNPQYFQELKKNRKLCQNYAVAATPGENVPFTIYYFPHTKEAGLSSLVPMEDVKRQMGPFNYCRTVTVQVRTLDQCMLEAGMRSIHFLSLDVEGGEMEVLKGFNYNHWRPWVIVLENHSRDNKFVNYLSSLYDLALRDDIDEYFVLRGFHRDLVRPV